MLARLKRKWPFLIVILVIIAGVYFVVAKPNNSVENKKKTLSAEKSSLDVKQIDQLMKPGNCANALPELSKVKPDMSPDSERLLTYRSTCYIEDAQYANALRDVERLRQIYVNTVQPEKVKAMDGEIAFLKKSASDPNYHSSTKNEDVTPEFAKKLREEN